MQDPGRRVQDTEPLKARCSTFTNVEKPDGKPRASSDTFTAKPTAGARGAPVSPGEPVSGPINCGAVYDTVTGAMAGTPTPGTNSSRVRGELRSIVGVQ